NLMTLECTLTPRQGPTRIFRGLNDAVIRAAPFFHLVEIGLSIDGESVMTYRGDGLIMATPVGSTAPSPLGGRANPPPQRPHVRGHSDVRAHTDSAPPGRQRPQGVRGHSPGRRNLHGAGGGRPVAGASAVRRPRDDPPRQDSFSDGPPPRP